MTGPTPFQCVQTCGRVLFAARGADICAFSLKDGSHLSTWKYPGRDISVEESTHAAKRRKVEEPLEDVSGVKDADVRRKKIKPKSTYQIPDQPIVSALVAATDGQHLVAVTFHDKVIHVFEHDGEGNLKDLSQRTMPKRPCSILLTPDNKTIFSADMFGDVYSIPLIDTLKPAPAPRAPSDSQFKTAATPLTVHTGRNLIALENQKLHQSTPTQKTHKDPSALSFVHTLLVGHVSMLTCISLARDAKGRTYILSADRDEHIRVSRGPPQSHVIETFCLGHKEFVSRICVPDNRPELLVSGGGDDEVFLWDWLGGKMLSRENLLSSVQEVVPDTKKIAVSGLLCSSRDGSNTTTVAVICERIPAVFILEIGHLTHFKFKRSIPLSANPLDMCFLDGPEHLIVSLDLMDIQEASDPLRVVSTTHDESNPSRRIHVAASNSENLSPEGLRKQLYKTEHLRKYEEDEDAEA